MPPPIVFVSCGQRHGYELELGNRLCDIITACGYEPFFAQRQSDLRALSEAIFDTLSRSSAYIAVLHRREKLDEGDDHRASLFVEQELVLAAYIRRIRDFPVLFYVQSGVERNGVRSTLLLNVSLRDRQVFEENAEVIEHVRGALPTLPISAVVLPGPNLRLEIKPTWARDSSNTIRINVYARNSGTEIPRAILRVWVPQGFSLPINFVGRAGREGDFELIQQTVESAYVDLDPERPTLLMTVPVPAERGVSEKEFKFRLVANGQQPQTLIFNFGQLWRAADEGIVLTESTGQRE